jgi:hypothetical protein
MLRLPTLMALPTGGWIAGWRGTVFARGAWVGGRDAGEAAGRLAVERSTDERRDEEPVEVVRDLLWL